jgi:hypothetical protein
LSLQPSQVIFRFRHSDAALGLNVGLGSREAQELAAQVHAGDTLRIYYEASGTLLPQKINLLSYQVERAGKQVLYPFAQMRRRYWVQGVFYGLLTLVFAVSAPTKVGKA